MLIFKQQILKFKSEYQVESVLNLLLFAVILTIFIVASLALYRPISVQQYLVVQQLAQQEAYPKTQHMALNMSVQETIRFKDYYRLVYAKHYESSHIKIYPAASFGNDDSALVHPMD